MSSKGGTVTLLADNVIKLAEDMESLARRLRDMASAGFRMDPAPRSSEAPQEAPIIGLDANIQAIDWVKKNREKAGPEDSWAWAFAYDKEDNLRAETKDLVQYIQQYGAAEIDGYKITLGGRDGKLLNRKKVKE